MNGTGRKGRRDEMRKHWKLIVYLAGYLILVITLAATQPLSDATGLTNPPDEVYRYLIPQYIYTHGVLPTGLEEEVRIPSYGFSYILYNGFPYIVMGLAMQAAGTVTSDPGALLFTARMVNVLAGLGMAYVVYLLSRTVFRKETHRWLFCLAVTYQPMNLFVHSYVNTDSYCMLSTAMIVYGLARQRRYGTDVRTCLWLAGGIALCALSYYSAYGYILAAAVLFVLSFLPGKGKPARRFDMKGFLKYGGLTAALVLVLAGWWFIRQGIVLNGDFLGLKTRTQMIETYGFEGVQEAYTYAGRGYSFFGMVGEMIREGLPMKLAGTLIAAYGSLVIRPGVWFYAVYMLVWGTGLAGCLSGYVRMIRERRKNGWKWHAFHLCMLACIILPLILYLRYCYSIDYQEQGRYLLPALVPAMVYVTKGIGRFPRAVAVGCAAAIVFCAFWQVFAVALPAFTA